jgi:hypothetical protein
VHHAHGGVAVAHLVDQHPHADQVVDVVEVAALDDHLAVDRVVVLGPALDVAAIRAESSCSVTSSMTCLR